MLKRIENLKIFIVVVSVMILASCIDQSFDTPPGLPVQEEDISNITIADLKKMHSIGDDAIGLTSQVIKGIVTSDDMEGNFFREIVIQDETGAILIRVDQTDLNILYPRGRLLYIKCEGLFMGDYNGITQLGVEQGGANVDRIPEALVENYFILGPKMDPLVPTVIAIDDLTQDHVSMLIQVNDAEFSNGEIGNTMGVAGGGSTSNRTVRDCDDNELTMRNSDFSDFASASIPEGNGSIVAIYSIFNGTGQITIRDMNDLVLDGTRCDGSTGGGGGGTGDEVSIASLRSSFENGATSAPSGFVVGTVISDVDNGNTTNRNLMLQNDGAGIVIRFQDGHSIPLGSQIKVNVSGVELSEFSGSLQLNELPNNNVSDTSGLSAIVPIDVCIGDLKSDLEDYESTVVRLRVVGLAGNDSYNGTINVTDNSGSIPMFTRMDASFSADAIPNQEVDLVGVASDFNGAQVFMRNLDDILQASSSDCMAGSGGNDECAGINGDQSVVSSVSEDFETIGDFEDIDYTGWSNINCKGNRLWYNRSFDDNGFAEMESFQDDDPESDAWLITPKLNLDAITSLQFQSAIAFYQHEAVVVLLSNDFDGNDPSMANWIELNVNLAGSSDENYEMINSGDFDLSGFSGEGHIAWRYRGTSAQNTTKFRIDNVEIN